MRKIDTLQELKNFQSNYEVVSGLPVPLEYLKKSQVFGFYKKKKLIAGYVLASNDRLRTIEVFANESNKQAIYNHFGLTSKFCEVCCFWMDKKYRENIFFNAWCWIRMAYQVKKQNQFFILFGTNSKGLALLYAYPKNESSLYHKDQVKGKQTFVFLSRRPDFVSGVWKIITSKVWSLKYVNDIEENTPLRKRILQEIDLINK